MKRIGIITYRDIQEGKGRFLQAYALYQAVRGLGYDAEILDYARERDNSCRAKLRRFFQGGLPVKSYLAEIPGYLFRIYYRREQREKNRRYLQYIQKNIKMSGRYGHFQELVRECDRYEAFVCGSDQIWNPHFLSRDPAYFLLFADERKRIAYAPSIGTNLLSDEEKEGLRRCIAPIRYLSVREPSTAKLLAELLGRDVFQAMDPTFLLPREWWREMASERIEREDYVLTFFFDNSSFPRETAERIAGRLNCKIVNIPDTFRDVFFCGKKYPILGPREFVSLFCHAKMVCTQSFHGTVLSLLYNRPFYVFDRRTVHYVPGVFARIEDLLSIFHLDTRIVRGNEMPDLSVPIPYDAVNEVMDQKREESMRFLKKALESVTGGSVHAG